jgi:hypothetical protein
LRRAAIPLGAASGDRGPIRLRRNISSNPFKLPTC